MPSTIGIVGGSVSPGGPTDWRSLVYDYWSVDDAVASTNLASGKGAVAHVLPVNTVTADGFNLSSSPTFTDSSASIQGVATVVKCVGLNSGTGNTLITRNYSGCLLYTSDAADE